VKIRTLDIAIRAGDDNVEFFTQLPFVQGNVRFDSARPEITLDQGGRGRVRACIGGFVDRSALVEHGERIAIGIICAGVGT
jgi:hypothetical protein